MKRLKFLMAFVFLLVGTLTVMSFTSEKYRKKALAIECLRWNRPQNPLIAADILNATYWSPLPPINPFPGTCPGGPDLCAICFDNSGTTPSEARQLLYDFYLNTGGMFPGNSMPVSDFNGNVAWVYQKVIQ